MENSIPLLRKTTHEVQGPQQVCSRGERLGSTLKTRRERGLIGLGAGRGVVSVDGKLLRGNLGRGGNLQRASRPPAEGRPR